MKMYIKVLGVERKQAPEIRFQPVPKPVPAMLQLDHLQP